MGSSQLSVADLNSYGTVADAAPGTRYTAYLELQPTGLAWLVAPLALLAMRRQDRKHMRRIREALESSALTPDGGGWSRPADGGPDMSSGVAARASRPPIGRT